MDLGVLVEQLRRGDPSAGAILVSVVAPRLLAYAGHLAPELNPADHEAIVETAIEKAILRIDEFDPERGTFPGWARTFVRYEVRTWRRTHAGATQLDDRHLEAADTAEPGSDEAAADAASRRNTAVTALVLSLPEPAQLLLRLRFAEELEHPAIAEQLGVKPATSRKRLQRILETLRELAADDPDLHHLGGE
jgi:RNA polymerase sigma factor (sigma-70 family)